LTKAEARSYIRRRRKQLDEETYRQANQRLYHQLFNFLSQINPGTVHCFLPILKNREVDTWPVISWLQEQHIRVAVSRSERESNVMQHFLLEETTRCTENAWGIPEPEGDKLVRIHEQEFDLILIPLLAFDQRGERVGYGKGYYDRFLATCRPEAVKVGLSLFPAVENISDNTPWDIRLDAAVTPEQVWLFTESASISS
jgi:5-formyltetrahydrofolate cyclo-ligase